MLRAIAGRWAYDGHRVTVLTSQPSYSPMAGIPEQPWSEVLDGVRVMRVPLFPENKKKTPVKVANALRFATGMMNHILTRGSYDMVMAATTPPVIVGAAACFAAQRGGTAFLYHCQDVHPEVSHVTGMMNNKLLYQMLLRVDRRTVNNADAVVVLSEDMRQTLLQRGLRRSSHIRIINNFVLPHFEGFSEEVDTSGVEEIRLTCKRKYRVVFAGNLGNFQNLDTVMEAAHKLAHRLDLEFVLLGDGAAKERLIHRAGQLVGRTVHFLGHRPQRVAERIVDTADLCLVTLAPGVIRTAYPSKTITYLSRAKALLVLAEKESELAKMVIEQQVGWSVEPTDAEALAKALMSAVQDSGALERATARAGKVADQLFGITPTLEKWSQLLQELSQRHGRAG